MKKKSLYILPSVLIMVVCLCSCTKENREMLYSAQEKKIESFVNSQLNKDPDLRVVYNGGSVRLVMIEGSGVELNSRGKVSILYAGYDFSSGSTSTSNMFTTNSHDFAVSTKWELTDSTVFTPLTVDMTDSNVIDGLRSGMEGVREGEECYILFTGEHAFGKDKNGTIPANAPLAFRIWVQNIEN